MASGCCRLSDPVYVGVRCRPRRHADRVAVARHERTACRGRRRKQSSLRGERAPAVLPRRRGCRSALQCGPTSSLGAGGLGVEGHQPGSVRRSIADYLGRGLTRVYSHRTGDQAARLGDREGVEKTITDVSRPYKNPASRQTASVSSSRLPVATSGFRTSHDQRFPSSTNADTLGDTDAVWTPDGRSVFFRTLAGIRQVNPDTGGAMKAIGPARLRAFRHPCHQTGRRWRTFSRPQIPAATSMRSRSRRAPTSCACEDVSVPRQRSFIRWSLVGLRDE